MDLENWDGSTVYAVYNFFSIDTEENDYTLVAEEYNGTAGANFFSYEYANLKEFL